MGKQLVLISFFIFLLFLPQIAEARDVRLALLVGHQYGWKKDPTLRYVFSGDLRPFAILLKKIGFEVKIIRNPTAASLQARLRWIQKRVKRRPRVSTFLFYYSGHADKNALHLGQKKATPFLYKTFTRYFSNIATKRKIAIFDSCHSGQIIQQFGSLQRYRFLLREGELKGVRRKRALDIMKLRFPNQGDEQGIRIISSSVGLSWEIKSYRASIFTHYLLQGLRGKADFDQDGKVDLDELFKFTRLRVKKVTGQEPQQLVVKKESSPYAIGPAYNSSLWVAPAIWGTLHVAIDNFYWSQSKRKNQALVLSVVQGKGVITLRQEKRCFRVRYRFKKKKTVFLRRLIVSNQVKCHHLKSPTQKGMIQLPISLTNLPSFALELQGGLLGSPLIPGETFGGAIFGGGNLYVHMDWLLINVGVWSTKLSYPHSPAIYPFLLNAKMAAGYRYNIYPFDFFLGFYLGGGLLFQSLSDRINTGGILQYGVTALLSYWFTPSFGLSIMGEFGFSLMTVNQTFRHHPIWSFGLGPRFHL